MGDRALAISLKVLTAFIAVFLGAALFPVSTNCGGYSPAVACMSNLKQTAMGALMYCADYDDRFPFAASWADASMPYVQRAPLFRCSETSPGATGHAFYRPISGRKLVEGVAEVTPAIFDSTDASWNAFGDLSLLPSRRHSNGTLGLAFADGHAVSLTRTTLIERLASSRHWPGWEANP